MLLSRDFGDFYTVILSQCGKTRNCEINSLVTSLEALEKVSSFQETFVKNGWEGWEYIGVHTGT